MFPIYFSEISGMFPTVLTFPEKFASLVIVIARDKFSVASFQVNERWAIIK